MTRRVRRACSLGPVCDKLSTVPSRAGGGRSGRCAHRARAADFSGAVAWNPTTLTLKNDFEKCQ